jgi:hypothetical protein
MSIESSWSVELPGTEKSQVLALLLEYFTGAGFIQHEVSYNRIVFRRNGYGSWKSAVSNFVMGSTFASAPMELEVTVQPRPTAVHLDLCFRLGSGLDATPADLQAAVEPWVEDFVHFCDEWTSE